MRSHSAGYFARPLAITYTRQKSALSMQWELLARKVVGKATYLEEAMLDLYETLRTLTAAALFAMVVAIAYIGGNVILAALA